MKQYFIGDLKWFARTMGFKNVSTGMLLRLAEAGKLKSPADLYAVTEADLHACKFTKAQTMLFMLGSKAGKRKTFHDVIVALKIKGVGAASGQELIHKFPRFATLLSPKCDIMSLSEVPGIASGTAANIRSYFDDPDNIEMIRQLIKHGIGR